MRRAALLVAVFALLGATIAPVPAAGQSDPTATVITIQVQPDGDARWSIAYRFELSDENETAAFEDLRGEFVDGTEGSPGSVAVFRAAASRVSDRTGTDMRITSVDRSATVRSENETRIGVLEVTFTWTNFATVHNESIAVGRAFEGGWFGDLSRSQTLVIEPPQGYQVYTARPSTDIVDGALQWEGPQQFAPGEPTVQFVPAEAQTTEPPVGPTQGIPWLYMAIGFVVLVIAATTLLAWRGGYLGDGEPAGGGEPPEEPGPPSEAASEEADEPSTEQDAAAAEPVDTELLSDEERVERLLREHDGRMKQARIVEETRWSNAKVSQLLSSMAEDDRVEKLRIGRENLISLPEDEDDES
ncbi:MAG: helix-turn-helix transcriptional regulator [Halodesulfurarchaeum sp.]